MKQGTEDAASKNMNPLIKSGTVTKGPIYVVKHHMEGLFLLYNLFNLGTHFILSLFFQKMLLVWLLESWEFTYIQLEYISVYIGIFTFD